jgi:hypothetical protein
MTAAGQVNDAEAAHPQRRRRRYQDAFVIRTAVRQRIHHSAGNFFGRFSCLDSYDTADSAHSALLYREAGCSSTLTSSLLRNRC